jgi:hypothetical protein
MSWQVCVEHREISKVLWYTRFRGFRARSSKTPKTQSAVAFEGPSGNKVTSHVQYYMKKDTYLQITASLSDKITWIRMPTKEKKTATNQSICRTFELLE